MTSKVCFPCFFHSANGTIFHMCFLSPYHCTHRTHQWVQWCLLLWGYRYHWVEVVLSLLDVHGVPGTHKASCPSIWGLNKETSEWFNELVNVSIFFSCWKKSILSTEDQWHVAIPLFWSLMKRLGKAWESGEMARLVKRLATQVCGPEFEFQHLHKKAYSTHS